MGKNGSRMGTGLFNLSFIPGFPGICASGIFTVGLLGEKKSKKIKKALIFALYYV